MKAWCTGAGVLLKAIAIASVLVLLTAVHTESPSAVLGESICAASLEEPAPIAQPRVAHARIAAVGDILVHTPISNSVHDSGSGTYDFTPVFSIVEPYLAWADYTVGNLESRLAGANIGVRAYPRLNAPDSLAAGLRGVGFDLVGTANNHCLDWGWEGLVNTVNTVQETGLVCVGTYKSWGDAEVPLIIDIYGLRVGFLDYTAETNGLAIAERYSFAYNHLERETVIEDAARARAYGADMVVALLHFGNEYQRQPTDAQRELARELCEGGVDVIIGAHPHVVQPIERITVERDGVQTECVVAYSLGNFVSNQRDRYRDCGIILYLNLEKDPNGARVGDVAYLPVWVQRARIGGRTQYRVLPVHPDAWSASDLALTAADRGRMSQVWDEMTGLLSNEEEHIAPLDFRALVDIRVWHESRRYPLFD